MRLLVPKVVGAHRVGDAKGTLKRGHESEHGGEHRWIVVDVVEMKVRGSLQRVAGAAGARRERWVAGSVAGAAVEHRDVPAAGGSW